ncbi:hypothetical protein [Alteromonas antoniana]|uniref:hypothetical protein n=1 Tax=Alteromonas antoniana TaxID=2803813 RepID=UPI001C4738A9|nr:hypothetical protein [Alteromonas antoniana]
MIKKAILTLLLPLSMVTLAHANEAGVACNDTSVSSDVVKKERSNEVVPGMLKASHTGCADVEPENSRPELTDSHDALLNPRLPGTLLATR